MSSLSGWRGCRRRRPRRLAGRAEARIVSATAELVESRTPVRIAVAVTRVFRDRPFWARVPQIQQVSRSQERGARPSQPSRARRADGKSVSTSWRRRPRRVSQHTKVRSEQVPCHRVGEPRRNGSRQTFRPRGSTRQENSIIWTRWPEVFSGVRILTFPLFQGSADSSNAHAFQRCWGLLRRILSALIDDNQVASDRQKRVRLEEP